MLCEIKTICLIDLLVCHLSGHKLLKILQDTSSYHTSSFNLLAFVPSFSAFTI